MNTYPLIRVKWSNEHSMAALFLVLILYHLPIWAKNPKDILTFLMLVTFGGLLDVIANVIRYKRIWCCVSGCVTAAIINLVSSGVPLWGQLLGVTVALVAGKYVWGGTGKNIFNPAMVGLLAILIGWSIPYPIFSSSIILLPALLLSLPFLLVRPYAGIGYILGAGAVMLYQQEFSVTNILISGVIFWGCIIMTDPVTVTGNKYLGPIFGATAGFFTLFYNDNIFVFVAVIITVNLLSYVLDHSIEMNPHPSYHLKLPKAFTYEKDKYMDLSGDNSLKEEAELGIAELSAHELIRIIKSNQVYGMGGAAFPTDKKLNTFYSSKERTKHLIINAAECDPGLIHDEFILRRYPQEIRKVIELLQNCLGIHRYFLL